MDSVSQVLSRLGGVYRDPGRVERDASTCLRSSMGQNLTPVAAPSPDNPSQQVLLLQGTIPLDYRGDTYQQLIDIYFTEQYPRAPPVCFVRLAENMYLKESHCHVDATGRVYLPYLSEWSPRKDNMVELIVNMSSVFSNEPPVFSRAPPPQPPPPAATASYSMSASAAGQQSSVSSYSFNYSNNDHNSVSPSVASASAAAQAAAKQQAEEDALQAFEKTKLDSLRQEVEHLCLRDLKRDRDEVLEKLRQDVRDKDQLEISQGKLSQQLHSFKAKKEELSQHIDQVETATKEIQEWLDDAAVASSSGTSSANMASQEDGDCACAVDAAVQPCSVCDGQMLKLAAESCAIEDALYVLDRALVHGKLDSAQHLKTVRRLAKEQFMAKAGLLKVQQHVAMKRRNGHTLNAGNSVRNGASF